MLFKPTLAYKLLLILLLIYATPFASFTQNNIKKKYTIKSTVLDSSTRKPVAYATVNIIDSAKNIVATFFSADDGTFNAELSKAGTYTLEVSNVGFRLFSSLFTLSEEKKPVEIGRIYLAQEDVQLKDVTVTARKQLIQQKPGMLVYNAENDVTNKGGSAADVLRKTPVISVDAQGNISMRGNGNIKILINGKFSGLMARSPGDALNMMPADIIKSVEVITSPSAKYDAEGAAGVINIITKKGSKNISGALEVAAGNLEQLINPRFAYSKGKLNINAYGHLHRINRKNAASQKRISLDNGIPSEYLQQDITEKNIMPHGSAEVKADYSIDSASELNFSVNTWFGNWPENSETDNSINRMNGSILDFYHQSVATKAPYLGADFNLGYNRRFKRTGQELFLMTQYTRGRDDFRYHTMQTDGNKQLIYQEQNDNKTSNNEWTLQADYIHPLTADGKQLLETGAKAILRKMGSEYNVLASEDGKPLVIVPQPARSDNFIYRQNVLAAYAMFKLNLQHDWFVQAGARWEGTYLKGSFNSQLHSFTNRFNNLVPSATFSKKIDRVHHLSLSYTQRISRPAVWDLNPNINSSDPKNLVTGNPSLKPETAHQVEFSHGMTLTNGMFFNTALFWKQTNNAIEEIVRIDSNGTTLTNKQNLASNRQYGINFSATLNITPVWSISNNLSLTNLKFNSSALQILNSGWATNVNLNTTYKLPRNYALQAFGDFNSRIITLQGYHTSLYYYSFAAKKELPSKAITISLSTVNPFNNYIKQSEAFNATGFTSLRANQFYNRSFKLTISFEFGKMIEMGSKKTISNDDVKGQQKG